MAIETIKHALQKGGAHLGDMVWWSLADARVDRTTLESLWAGAQLDPVLLPDAPSSEKALKLAVREAGVGQAERLLRLAKESPEEIIFAVVREQRPGDGSLDYHQEARIQLDRQREVFSSDQPTHDLVAAVKSKFELYGSTHHSDDIRRTITRALDSMAAVALRPSGGVYWIAAPFADKLRRLQSAIEKIGASRVYVLPVHESAESRSTLGEIAKASVEDDLAALQTEIATFLQTPPDRSSTLMRRFDAFESLRSRAKLYRDVLNVQVTDLDQQLSKMASTVEELLNQKAA